jgi:hypothetical protein
MLITAVAPVLLIQLLMVVLWVMVGIRAAFVAQFLLTTIWLLLAFTYVVKDSKSRWPEASAFQRLSNIITLKS